MGFLNLKFLKLDHSDLRNFKFKKGQEGVIPFNLKFLTLDQSDLRNFKFKKRKEGNTFQLEISETRPVGFKKFQIQEGARGSNTFQFKISQTRPVGFKKFQIQEGE